MTYWWVNQGVSYREERRAGILWAPKRTSNNQTRSHWETMDLVSLGDRIFHFADQHVKAMSAVTATSVDSRKPADLSDALWDPDGRLVRTTYVDASRPVFREEIPAEWRAEEPASGPFQQNLAIKLGYLAPVG